jgi:allantoinase
LQNNFTLDDHGDLILMPGLIDINVNLQELSKEPWEGFEFGTMAAAAGGVTTLLDFPMMKRPSLNNLKSLEQHVQAT